MQVQALVEGVPGKPATSLSTAQCNNDKNEMPFDFVGGGDHSDDDSDDDDDSSPSRGEYHLNNSGYDAIFGVELKRILERERKLKVRYLGLGESKYHLKGPTFDPGFAEELGKLLHGVRRSQKPLPQRSFSRKVMSNRNYLNLSALIDYSSPVHALHQGDYHKDGTGFDPKFAHRLKRYLKGELMLSDPPAFLNSPYRLSPYDPAEDSDYLDIVPYHQDQTLLDGGIPCTPVGAGVAAVHAQDVGSGSRDLSFLGVLADAIQKLKETMSDMMGQPVEEMFGGGGSGSSPPSLSSSIRGSQLTPEDRMEMGMTMEMVIDVEGDQGKVEEEEWHEGLFPWN